MKPIITVIILFILSGFYPQASFAQESWQINNYSSNISIQDNGEVVVEETIAVDFGNLEKHGIYRDIPYVYERDGTKTYTEIKVAQVLKDNSPGTYDVVREDNYIRIKIGDADSTIGGKHTYQITYTAVGILRGFDTHDELYWNVIGPYWEVPIERSSATVILPQSGMEKVDCFVGTVGSTFHCSSELISPERATFTASRVLNPYEAFTIVVGYQKGLVPLITAQRPKTFFEKFVAWPSLTTLFIVVISGIGTVFYIWSKYGRDFWNRQKWFEDSQSIGEVKPIGGHETIVVEYEPPLKLRPAEIGVLLDEIAHTHDVTATIIDLATRGYLIITEVPKSWVFGKIDYLLRKHEKDHDELLPYEKKLLSNLFKTGTEVKISSLKKTFYQELKEVKEELYKSVVEKKFFFKDPDKVRGSYLAIGLLVAFFGVFLIFFSIGNDLVFGADVGGGVGVGGVLLILFSKFMPRRTAYGRELYRRVLGYRLFISSVEKHRQKFFEKKNMFNEVLPYAIVFELTDKFAKAMQEMGVKPQVSNWYVGSRPFTITTFHSSMNSFTSSFSQAIASTPSGSGFSSSGGSSGGGFGGGGGGSW